MLHSGLTYYKETGYSTNVVLLPDNMDIPVVTEAVKCLCNLVFNSTPVSITKPVKQNVHRSRKNVVVVSVVKKRIINYINQSINQICVNLTPISSNTSNCSHYCFIDSAVLRSRAGCLLFAATS